MNVKSPCYKLYIDDSCNSIYIKRDDLLPFSFGGNKVRIANEFVRDMKLKNKNFMIGYGNSQSNLSRALANICSREKIPCCIISPADDDGISHSFNESLTRYCGCNIFRCNKNNVGQAVEYVMTECTEQGYSPYYINGNKFGKGNEVVPVKAYIKTYDEILEQEKCLNITFDYIFLPIGTGMTQSGLLCGVYENKKDTKIVGISIARSSCIATNILSQYISSLYNHVPNNLQLIVDDTCLFGGYGESTECIMDTIKKVYLEYGVPLDPTYSGKAFYGMNDYLRRNKIKGKNILFLHTGGTPLFFDHLTKTDVPSPVIRITDTKKLVRYLYKIDKELSVSLTSRCNIDEYARKILDNGIVLGIEENGEVCAASLFYCNDSRAKKAYLSLIGVLPYFTRKGYGGRLLDESILYSSKCGMTTFTLDTDIENTTAISLYSKKGFVIEGIQDKLHMKKCISSLEYDRGGGI